MKKVKWVLGWSILLVVIALRARAQPALPTPPAGQILNYWPFDDTNLLSGRGSGPRAATNLLLVPSWNNYSLQMDDTNPCALIYNVVDTNATDGQPETNLTLTRGTIEAWVSADWDSGTGPGNWGTLLEVGNWDTNLTTNSSSWGLFFSPDRTSLNFSAENGLSATNYFSAPISWNAGDWHYVVLTYDQANTNVSLYLDGDLATTSPSASPTCPAPKSFPMASPLAAMAPPPECAKCAAKSPTCSPGTTPWIPSPSPTTTPTCPPNTSIPFPPVAFILMTAPARPAEVEETVVVEEEAGETPIPIPSTPTASGSKFCRREPTRTAPTPMRQT